MKDILVIDHKVKEKTSYFIPDLLDLIAQEGIKTQYVDRVHSGFNALDYAAVISASGNCMIIGNKELKDENQFMDRCEEVGTPTFYIGHGAQIKAVRIAGDGAIVKAESPRTDIHSDYIATENAEDDPILTEVDIGKLISKEYHKYDITKIGDQHQNLLVDPNGNTILAGHKDPDVISYLMQMHSELKQELHPKVDYGFKERLNSAQILINFLSMVKLRE